jgi:ATP-binding cassette, subfamily B, bacterial
VDGAARLVTGITPAALEAPVRLAALFGALWVLHPPMATITAGVLVPAVILERWLGRALRVRFRELFDHVAALYEAAQESLSAAEIVKVFAREEEEIDAFRARTRARVRKENALVDLQAAEDPVGQVLRLAALIGVLAYGAQDVAAGRLSPGALGAALLAAHAFLGALQSVAGLFSGAQAGLASADRVFAILDERPSVPPPARRRDARFGEALRFERVSFRYPGRERGLEDVTFEVRPGEHVALAGPTGSGKTTVLRLALRLFDPSSGAITLDGVDLRELDPAELRRLFAVVPQDVLLFDRTLAENIAFGSPGAGRTRVDDAARLVGLDPLVSRLPRGLDTALGTRALALSAGERQRIALARAIVRDAPIVLLDEATSALDMETEREIAGVLARHARGRALLTVSHRVSNLRAAARILVLEDGRVSEQGTHAGLLERDGLYRRLFEARERSAP